MNRKEQINKRKSSKLSTGEKIVNAYLRKAQIKFIREHYHPELINDKTGHLLFFDFYLPRLNVVIEVDGRHHHEAVDGNEEKFKDQQYRDTLKNIFCLDRGIKMLRLNYCDLKPPMEKLNTCLGTCIDLGRHIHKKAKKAIKRDVKREQGESRPKKKKKQRSGKVRLTARQIRNKRMLKRGQAIKKTQTEWFEKKEAQREAGRMNYPPDLRERFSKLREPD